MKSLCLKRINKDIKEITNAPLEGIGIISLDNDPMKYIVNIRIMTGIYEGYCLQLLLTFFDNYPIRPPKILIYPGQLLDHNYHHHIFKDNLLDEKGRHFNKFCFDLLDNDFMSTSSEHSGWNPSYTISSLLLQVQSFLSIPDLPITQLPSEEKIKELMKSMYEYENIFKIKNDNGEEIIKVHTWKNPYPEIYCKKKEIEKNNEDKIKNKIKEDLTCFISRNNYIDDKNILLGYPIRIKERGKFIPIPEILSYDCFIEQELSKNNYTNLFDNFFWEPNNNENAFNNNIDNINNINNNDENNTSDNVVDINNNNLAENNVINANNIHDYYFNILFPEFVEMIPRIRRRRSYIFDFLYSNESNKYNKKYEFKSANNELYNTWLPIYINENHFKKNETTILNYFSILKYGNSGLQKYDFQPKYIFEIMPNIFTEMIIKMANNSISSSFLKCFFQYILLYKKLKEKYKSYFIKYQKYYLKSAINIIYSKNEIIDIIKQIFKLLILFYLDGNEIRHEIKSILKKYIKLLKNIICFQLFEFKSNFKFKNQRLFIDNLKKHNLFNKIANLLILDKNNSGIFYNKKDNVFQRMKNNFKELYYITDKKTKLKIKNLIMNELNFSDYFNVKLFIKKFSNNDREVSEHFRQFALFLNLRKEINKKEFYDNLEKNYGICLNTENIIKDLKDKINNNYLKNKYEIFCKNKYLYKMQYLILLYLNIMTEINYKYNILSFCLNFHRRNGLFYRSFYNFLEERINFIQINNNISPTKKNYNKRHDREIIKRDKKNLKLSCNKVYNKQFKKYITLKK